MKSLNKLHRLQKNNFHLLRECSTLTCITLSAKVDGSLQFSVWVGSFSQPTLPTKCLHKLMRRICSVRIIQFRLCSSCPVLISRGVMKRKFRLVTSLASRMSIRRIKYIGMMYGSQNLFSIQTLT